MVELPETAEKGVLVLCDYFGTPLNKGDCEKILDDYYDERGWDVGTGIPSRNTLLELGLEDVADELKGMV